MATFNNMDLNLLRVFQAIAEERSLTLAGNRLHLSQPAVSYALGRLRQIFDDPLFIRTKEGMQPTPTAIELAKPISRALQAVQDALRYTERFDPATSTRVFRASMTDVAEMMFLPDLCEILTEQAPGSRLQVEQVAPAHLEEALRTGQLDFAFGNLPALKPVTHYELLFRENYVCLMRRRDGLPQRRHLELDEFLAMSHVLVESAESSHHQVENSFRGLGVERKISLSIPHFTVLPRILEKSNLVATVPLRIAKLFQSEHPESFVSYQLPVEIPTVDVTLHWHQAFDNDAGNSWLRQIFIDLLQQYGRSS
ncbi:LysR family transcriptional regulator [Herbaspirillum sp. alder98]|uniref:LysR family transcriptional regulator n=1 Tax=Herbaspirillum sp. alder98 TaxID=2913096 RepID=UPI001CD82212|nr:LysR family transcriptional regulator [Herbaspirillum sp. alder98]MCA1325823.1 LysR family transcriptional regulator [Herbaspirillum sp. alder98]